MISECSTVPLEDTSKFSFSTTSRKISFFLCLMPVEGEEGEEKEWGLSVCSRDECRPARYVQQY